MGGIQKKTDTAVVIVNWNGKKLLFDCLDSLGRQIYQNFKIILVDNGSVDGSVEYVRENFTEAFLLKGQIEIIELGKNTGFAKGNNIGIYKALESDGVENIVLLNNDTKVESDFLEKLVNSLNDDVLNQKYKKIGALVPKMLLGIVSEQCSVSSGHKKAEVENSFENKNESIIDSVGSRIGLDGRGYSIGHGEKDKGQYDEVDEVFGFCGGAVLLKREMLEDIIKISSVPFRKGGRHKEYFDDIFFAYYEDADLSCRMRLRGWQTVMVPSAVVYHLHSATTDKMGSSFKAYYLNRNRFLMMFKNFPAGVLWRSLSLVPKSYFALSGEGNKVEKSAQNKKKRKNKVRMVWVMTRVGCSLFLNLLRLIWQRRQIQSGKLVSGKDFERWLV